MTKNKKKQITEALDALRKSPELADLYRVDKVSDIYVEEIRSGMRSRALAAFESLGILFGVEYDLRVFVNRAADNSTENERGFNIDPLVKFVCLLEAKILDLQIGTSEDHAF